MVMNVFHVLWRALKKFWLIGCLDCLVWNIVRKRSYLVNVGSDEFSNQFYAIVQSF